MPGFEDAYTLSVVIFIGALALLVWRDRKNIEFHPFLIMRRTKKFRDVIDHVASSAPRFWKAVGTLGIIVALVGMTYGIVLLAGVAQSITTGMVKQPALQFFLPGPGPTAVTGPGYVLLPFWIWLVIISTILIPHELMHGIIARAENIPLRSVGLLLLLIIPGAFVEPDEKKLQKAKLLARLRVFAAGSFANFATAGIALALVALVVWPASASPAIGLNVTFVNESSPFAAAGITPGMMITAIDGRPLTASYWEYVGGNNFLSDELGKPQVGKPVTFTSDGKDYIIAPILNPATGNPWFGFYASFGEILHSETAGFLVTMFTLLWILSSGVAIVNILPLKPLDGGLFLEAVARKYAPKHSKLITKAVTLSVLGLLVFAFIGPGIWSFF